MTSAARISRLTALLSVLPLAFASACSSEPQQTLDMTPNPTPDLMPMYQYKAATIREIDLDPGNGPFGNAQRVVLDRVVAVSKVDKYVNSANQQCRYQIWVQDPLCTMPPCGLVVKAIGPMAPSATSSGKDCPSANNSGTLLATIGDGDNIRVRGKVVVEVDSVAPMTVVEHQLFIESFEEMPKDSTINPLVLTDTVVFGQFVTHLGQTWNKYEGMLLTLKPTAGKLSVSSVSGGGFRTNPGGTDWGNTFDGDYYPAGATAFPVVGSLYQSITGVASMRHGGELLPLRNKDFVP